MKKARQLPEHVAIIMDLTSLKLRVARLRLLEWL